MKGRTNQWWLSILTAHINNKLAASCIIKIHSASFTV